MATAYAPHPLPADIRLMNATALLLAAIGALALAGPGATAGATRAVPAASLLEQVFGRDGDEDHGFFKFKKPKKHHGKGKGRWKDD